jgi:hypothetical protein
MDFGIDISGSLATFDTYQTKSAFLGAIRRTMMPSNEAEADEAELISDAETLAL